MKIPFAPSRFRYHTLRPVVSQPLFWALFLLGATLNLFRVDMLGQKLVVLGQDYPFEFQYLIWLPVGFYGAVILIGVISFVWGRLFCGWSCPHNTMTELTRPFRAVIGRDQLPLPIARLFKKYPPLKTMFNISSLPLAIAITYALAMLLSFYVVPPNWALAQYASGRPHIALVFGHLLFTLIGLFLLYAGHDFCRTCCPYGMAQSLSAYQEGKWRPMEIQFSGAEFNDSGISEDCKTCTGCQSVCPVNIDPRKPEALNLSGLQKSLKVGQFNGCFNCGECIDACKSIQRYKQRDGLLSFQLPWQQSKQS